MTFNPQLLQFRDKPSLLSIKEDTIQVVFILLCKNTLLCLNFKCLFEDTCRILTFLNYFSVLWLELLSEYRRNHSKFQNFRSRHRRCSVKNSVLKNFAIFTKRLKRRLFPVNIAKVLRTTILKNISELLPLKPF